MRFTRIITIFALVLALFQGAVYANNTLKFKDVPIGYWAEDAINSLAEQGIISGSPDGKFNPNDSITREQLAKVLVLTLKLEASIVNEPTFTDVPASSWAFSYVEAAKPYLTGYFPTVGKPFFDPHAQATREDMAVALVRALGMSDDGINGEDVLQSKFRDHEKVTPQLVNEVAVAIHNKLVQGMPDGTFQPKSPIDRASAATLLYRVQQSSYYFEATKDIELMIDLPATTNTSNIEYSGSVTKGAKLFVNGEEIAVENGKFEQKVLLPKEGKHEFVFKAVMPNGKSRTYTKTIEYLGAGPELIVDVPDTSGKPYISVTGKVKDVGGSGLSGVSVSVNDMKAYVSNNGEWTASVLLKEGANVIKVVAQNEKGNKTTVTKEVSYLPSTPVLTFDSLPEITNTQSLTISGRVEYGDGFTRIYINDMEVGIEKFSVDCRLKPGENHLLFKAVNLAGKSTEILKVIVFYPGGPKLTVNYVPETTTSQTITLSGRATDPYLFNSNKIYINGEDVGLNSFAKVYTLNEGENVFTLQAVNDFGTTEVITKKVVYTAPE